MALLRLFDDSFKTFDRKHQGRKILRKLKNRRITGLVTSCVGTAF